MTVAAGFEMAAYTPSAIGLMSNKSSADEVETATSTKNNAIDAIYKKRFIDSPRAALRSSKRRAGYYTRAAR